VDNLRSLLKDDDAFKNLNKEFDKLSIEDVTNLLKNNEKVLDDVVKHLTENKKDLEMLLGQANKVEGMEEKLEALGDQLLTQGVIGGAAVTALTGALAGTLAIGGVAGAINGWWISVSWVCSTSGYSCYWLCYILK
jgi:hypothetical protein